MSYKTIVKAVLLMAFLGPGPSVYAQQGSELGLARCVDMALERSDLLKKSAADIGEAEAGLTRARSGYFPRIQLEAEAVRVNSVPSAEFGMFSVDLGADRYTSFGLHVEQPLYLGGRTKAFVQAAESGICAERERYKRYRQTVILNTALLYLDILRLRDVVRVDREAVELKKKHLKDINSRRRAGTASKYELLRAEAEKLSSEGVLTGSLQELSRTRYAFAETVGCAPDADLAGSLTFRDIKVDTQREIAAGLRIRADLHACSTAVAVFELKRRADKADYYPHIFVRGSTGRQKPEFGEFGGEDRYDGFWNIGVGMRLMLFSGFERRSRLAAGDRRIERARAEYAMLKKRIEREIRDVCMMIDRTSDMVGIQKQAVAKAEEALKLVTEGYKTDVNTQLEVLDAQLQVSRRKKDLANAVFYHESARIRLEFDTGRLNRKWIRSR